VTLEADEIPFIPVVVLNGMRRQGIALLTQARQASRPVPRRNLRNVDIPWPQKELTYAANVLNKHAEAFYRRHGVQKIELAPESGTAMRGKKVMTAKYCIKYAYGLCPEAKPPDASRVHHPEPWTLIDNKNRHLNLRFDCARCHMEIFLDK
jgi:putative protease